MGTGLAQAIDPARDEAEHWFVRLRADDCSAHERAAFERWLGVDPAHALAYQEVERIWRASIDLLQDPALAGIRAEAQRRSPHTPARPQRWQPLAWAAAIVVAVGVGGVSIFGLREVPVQPAERHATVLGQQRTLELADHSKVLLDTDTAIDVRFGRGERRVTLVRGRAEFAVAHDANKPFIVETGRGIVRALGTRFQVQEGEGMATVLLLEGSVAVTATADGDSPGRSEILQPGEELAFDAGGRIWRKRSPDLSFAQGWTQGDLVFNERPLAELLAEANRYGPARLRLGDPTLGDIRISGVFHAGDQQAMLLALKHGWNLHAERVSEQEIVLTRRN